jgi:hypothetical protein
MIKVRTNTNKKEIFHSILFLGRKNHEKSRVLMNKPLSESNDVIGTCDGPDGA